MNEAPGFMITTIDKRMFFIETNNFPEFKDGYIELHGDKAFELFITPVSPKQIQCTSELLKKTPLKTTWIKIPEHAIVSIQKILENSFIWQSVVQCRSNIILASDFKIDKK